MAGGTAGKFSAVMGSWSAGPRGSQMVTYPLKEHMPITLVNPMNETAPQAALPAPRLRSLEGKTDRAARYQQAGRQHLSGSPRAVC